MQTPIETLDMDVRMYNTVKREGIQTVEQLLGRMYQPEGIKHFSTRFQRDIERVLKQKGMVAYIRGEYAAAEDLYSTPLTWEQLHAMCGKLVAIETSIGPGIPNRYRVCWVYAFNDADDRVQIQYSNDFAAAAPISNFYALKDFPPPEPPRQAAPTLAETAGAAPEIQGAEIVPQEAAPLADDTASAWTLHRRIMANISTLVQSLAQMCQDIKKMRDTKLYKAMGYDTFEAYTEREIGIKRRQAYTYVQIAERLPEDFVRDTAQIGVQKLALLASITADQREVITEDINLTETTVKQLKAKIAEITHTDTDTGTHTGTDTAQAQHSTHTDTGTDTQTAQKQAPSAENHVEDVESTTVKALQEQIAQIKKQAEEAEREKEKFYKMLQSKNTEWINAKNEVTSLTVQVGELKQQVEELKSRPAEVPCLAQAQSAENPVEDVETGGKEFERLLQNVENALDDICIFLEDSEKGTKEMNQKLWRMLIDYAGSLES